MVRLSMVGATPSSALQLDVSVVSAVPFIWPRLGASLQTALASLGSEVYAVVAPQDEHPRQSVQCAEMSGEACLKSCDVDAIVLEVVRNSFQVEVEMTQPLMEALADSMAAMELRQAVSGKVGLELPATLMFDYPTVEAIGAYVRSVLGSLPHATHTIGAVRDQSGSAQSTRAIRCDTMGGSENRLHTPVSARRDLTCEWPGSRYDVGHPDGDRPILACFLCDLELHDRHMSGLAASEEVQVDPQQRLLLRDATSLSNVKRSKGSSMGVAIGIAGTEYAALAGKVSQPVNAFTATSSALSVASGRIAYTHGLQGPTFSVDTACSASLVAFHSARLALTSTHAAIMMVSGVMITISCISYHICITAGMLGEEGRCKTLDESADGDRKSVV